MNEKVNYKFDFERRYIYFNIPILMEMVQGNIKFIKSGIEQTNFVFDGGEERKI